MAILSTKEVMEKFKIGSFTTILMLFREKNLLPSVQGRTGELMKMTSRSFCRREVQSTKGRSEEKLQTVR